MGRCERVVAADGPQCVLMRSSNTFFGGSKFAALHMSARGTNRPFYACRRMSVLGGKAVMQPVFGSIHMTCLSPLVTDRAMEA